MIKILKHIPLFLLAGLIIFLLTSVRLNDYFPVRFLDFIVWPLAVLMIVMALFYKWRHKACFLLAVCLISPCVWAGPNTVTICTYYKQYEQRIRQYEANHFRQDEKCDASILQMAREEARQNRLATDSSTTSMAQNLLSGSCATQLMTLCSEYNRRHPEETPRNQRSMRMSIAQSVFGCWPCDMTLIVFLVIQDLSSNLANMMSSVALIILTWVTAFWLVYKAAGMVLTSKGGTFFSQIATGMLFVIIVAFILRHPTGLSEVYSKVLSPMMQFSLYISDQIQDGIGINRYGAGVNGQQPFYRMLISSQSSNQEQVTDYCGYISGNNTVPTVNWFNSFVQRMYPTISNDFRLNLNGDQTLLTGDLQAQLLCLTQKFYYQAAPFILAGQNLIYFSMIDNKTFRSIAGNIAGAFVDFKIPKSWAMLVVGVCLVVLFVWFSFLVALRIMDIFLKLGFVMVLMPLFFVTAIFPITRGYTFKALKMLFQTIIDFIGLAIAASFSMLLLETAISPNSSRLVEVMSRPINSRGDADVLLDVITSQMSLMNLFIFAAIIKMCAILMHNFPIIVAFLFNVDDTSSKGDVGTTTGAAFQNQASNVMAIYGGTKKLAQTSAANPYKTKEKKAQEAEKDLQGKKRKLNEEKKNLQQSQRKLNQFRGTFKESEAQKEVQSNQEKVKKAQKAVDDAQVRATAFRADANRESRATAPSRSGYVARRFGDNTGNAIRKGGAVTAQAVEKAGSAVGNVLMKNGLSSIVAVPVVLGSKVMSMGVRTTAKTLELGAKGIGRLGEASQKLARKITGRPPPPPPP